MAASFPFPFSKFVVHKVNPKELKRVTVPTIKNEQMDIKFLHDEPGATTGFEDFLPRTTFEWFFWHDEVQYVMMGKADITYALPPLYQRWEKTKAEPGCIYLVPRGAHVKFKITSKEPYRHLFVVMPGGCYPQNRIKG